MPASREQAIKNLKGKTGAKANPNGRPKSEWTWAGVLKKALEEAPEGDPRQYKELIAESLRLKAIEGDVQAIKEFGDRIDGKPKQSLDVENSGEVKFIVTRDS
jgi:hypothetical protein